MQGNSAFVNLLETKAKQRNATVGRAFQSHIRATQSVGLTIGGIAETQDMLDFCVKHNFTADVEVIPIQKINEAYERLLKSDVKCRFSIDMASMKLEEQAGMTTMRPRH